MIYLDSAATSLLKPSTVEHELIKALRSFASPGRGGHRPSLGAASIVYDCREAAAELFNVDNPERIVFTFNATHALNIAINSLAAPGSTVLVSGFEHNSVTRPLKALGADIVRCGTTLFDPADTLKHFEENIKRADLVVCTHVSNVFGYILPIYDLAELCMKNRVPLIVDASQSAGILKIDAKKLGAAFICMPGHKGLMGPQGTGILICGFDGVPLMYGGSGSDSISQNMPEYLPERLEAGTHNVCGIAGLLAGIRYVSEKGTENIFRHENGLMKTMIEELDGEKAKLYVSYSSPQAPVLSCIFPGFGCEELAHSLGQRDICVRAGLHCAPFAHQSAGTEKTGTVRISFSPFLDERQIKKASDILKQIINNA